MRRVQVESPFRGETPEEFARNQLYLAACLRDCVQRGETPYASHRVLTMDGVLRDDVQEERAKGILAGFAMRRGMHGTAVYVDLGWTTGMILGWRDAFAWATETADDGRLHGVEVRLLGGEWAVYGLTNANDPRVLSHG